MVLGTVTPEDQGVWSEAPPTRRPGRWWRIGGAAVVTAVVLGVPTDVIDSPVFVRVVPVRWWEYAVLLLVSVLVGAWAGGHGRRGVWSLVAGLVATGLSLGCPHCNRLVVWLIGMDRTLTWWALAQSVLAVIGITLMSFSVARRYE